MTDRYENIRKALAMGPTPGPWKWWEYEDSGYCCVNPRDGGLLIAKCDVRNPFDQEQRANAALIAACDPDTIRALLEERDALAAEVERLKSMTAVTMGVGSGDGSLYVHGDYDSIKAAQALVIRAERLEEVLEERDALRERLGKGANHD